MTLAQRVHTHFCSGHMILLLLLLLCNTLATGYRMEVDVLRRVSRVSRPLTLVVGGPTHSCKVSPETAYVIGELGLKRVEFAAQAVVFVEVLGLWVGAVGVAVAGRVLGVRGWVEKKHTNEIPSLHTDCAYRSSIYLHLFASICIYLHLFAHPTGQDRTGQVPGTWYLVIEDGLPEDKGHLIAVDAAEAWIVPVRVADAA